MRCVSFSMRSSIPVRRYGCLYVLKRADISMVSMVVMCYAGDSIKYDRRTPELSNAPLHMKLEVTSIEKKADP